MPHVPILLQSAPIDLSGIGQAIVGAIQGAMPQLATSAAQASVPAIQTTAPVLATSAGQSVTTGGSGLIDALQSNPLNVLTSTPPGLTYANGGVQQLQAVTLTAALAALALIIAWAGFQVIVHSSMGGLDFGEAFGRIVVGAAMLAAVPICTAWVLEAMNALSTAVLSAHVYSNVLKVTVDLLDGGAGLVLTAIVELAALWLYVVMWGRIVLLDVLLVFAPLAVACWILPQTRCWFSLWVRNYVGWALVGPAVTLVLVLGLAISGSLGREDGSARLAALGVVDGCCEMPSATSSPTSCRTFAAAGSRAPLRRAPQPYLPSHPASEHAGSL